MRKLKRVLLATAVGALAVTAVTSCSKKSLERKDCYIVDADKKTEFNVGVLQFLTHDALDKATSGFKDAINEAATKAGKKVNFTVNNPETEETTMKTYATNLVRSCDLVMGNATPAATALKTAAITESKNVPILFTSTTDPVDAKLVKDTKSPERNITGTSDANPVNEQIDLLKDFDPAAKKIGFLYTASESNSKVQCDAAAKYAKSKGLSTYTQTIVDMTGIAAAINKLNSEGCKAIYIPTDNLLASNMTAVKNATEDKKIVVICGEESMVDNGGTFTLSIDYYKLGRTTGEMANALMFEGKHVKDVPVQSQTNKADFKFACNFTSLSKMGYELSSEFMAKYGIMPA